MKIAAPQIPAQLDDDNIVVSEDALFESLNVMGVTMGSLIASSVSFDECVLVRPTLATAKLPKLTMRDCKITGGDLSATSMTDGGMQRVELSECRMTGFDVSNTILKDVVFRNCKLDMANFRFAKLTNVLFDNCILVDADFQNATLKHVRIKDCPLERTTFFAVNAQDVDLRGSQLIDVRGWQDAKGFVIDSTQLMSAAHQLAHALDITVEDD